MDAQDTRAATLEAVVERLHRDHMYEFHGSLTIHLVGADHREGNSSSETLDLFRPFISFATDALHLESLVLVLIGPNVARSLHQVSTTTSESNTQVSLAYYVGTFEEYQEDAKLYVRPDLAVCFNAGVWGYDSWLSTLETLACAVQTPVVITSYNENEAGDDEDAVDTIVEKQTGKIEWLWQAEKNPYGSKVTRSTANDLGSILRENDHWMCIGPVR